MQTYPLSEAGAASDVLHLLGTYDGLCVEDLTALPRFGLKGPGAVDWFTAQGFDLPSVNTFARQRGMVLLRLGTRDIMLLGEADAPDAVDQAAQLWAASPQGYSSWREEAWAWLRLTGPAAPDVMSRLTAFDIRDASFAVTAIAQTRVAHLDIVMIRAGGGFDLLFDIASTAQVLRDIAVARQAGTSVDSRTF